LYVTTLKYKHIKKLKKIGLIVLLVIISLPTGLFFLINSDRVQNKVAEKVTVWLSKELGNHISLSHVRVSWFNRVTVTDLYVTGLRGDTILYAPEIIGRLNLFAFSSRQISIRKAILRRADIRFALDPERDEINIKFIIEKLKSKDSSDVAPRWDFDIQHIELDDCRFSFTNPTKTFDRPFGMDYANLRISHLNLHVSDFRPGNESEKGVRFRIRKLACSEQCGLEVRSLSADFFVNSSHLSFKDVHIITDASEIRADDVSFVFRSFQDFGNGQFISKVNMNINVTASKVDFCELSCFVPVFGEYPSFALMTGTVTGTIDNLKGENIHITCGSRSNVQCNFDLKGLPDIRSTFIYADVADLTTCPADMEQIRTSRAETGHIILPETMKRLKEIRFVGNFTGFFDDFVTYGTFSTNLGNLSTDLAIKPVAAEDTSFTFRGKLNTEQFHLGQLLKQPSIGKITMNGMVEGVASGPGNIRATIEGLIKSVYLKDYSYRDISVNGAINNRMYDGKLSIDEPNIKMDFSGKVDLTNPAVPSFDFWANVERAKLYPLKLADEDTSSFVSFSITAGFSGTNIDNVMGDFRLENSLIRRKNREIEINNLLLFTKNIKDTNSFILRSDILDAEIFGQYQFLKLPESFLSLVKNYAPAWSASSTDPDSLSQNKFRFEAEFKDTEKLTYFFLDEFHIMKGSRLEGIYNPSQKDVQFALTVPSMYFNGKIWRDFFVTGATKDTVFQLTAGSRIFKWNRNISFENFSLMLNAQSDSVDVSVSWNNWDSVLNKGALHSRVFFENRTKGKIPLISIFTDPGQITTSGDRWAITHQGILIDSSRIAINNLQIKRPGQEIAVAGVISTQEEDKLLVNVKNVNLSVLNSSLQFKNMMFGGTANGTVSLSNLYRIPVLVSDMHVKDFSLNGGLFGDTNLSAAWNASDRNVYVDAESLLNDLRTLYAHGNYNISGKNLNFDIQVENAPATVFQPYIENIFTNMEGAVSIQAQLTGTVDAPLLNGTARLQNTALTLDYTKTRYSCSGNADIRNNVVLFNDIQIQDRFGNTGKLNGSITAQHLRTLQLNIQLNTGNLEVLNTTERDNESFYGKAFAGGNIRITGNPNDLTMNINVRTAKNTLFNIPIVSNEDVAHTSFISFVDHTVRPRKYATNFRKRYRPAGSAGEAQEEQKTTINLSVDVTPEAEVQLIFDSKIGDIVRAKGTGNISLNITNNRFDMFGTYVVEEGDYLFTVQNVFNKHFVLEKGGMITWNGSPTDALLNLKAKYTTKPPLSDLMGSVNENGVNRSVVVECVLHITNKLTDPNVRFELVMPNAQQEIRSFLSAATNTDEELSQQFLWLLIMNRFYVEPSMSVKNTENPSGSSGVETMALGTASEFMTSQLSRMLSQWSNNFDVNLSYHPGMGTEGQNFGMDLSTDVWSIHVNYEVGGMKAAETSSNVLGDFTFDAKLNKSGKLRFKAFNRSNEQYFIQAPYTQGIGLLYREDFNRVKDIFFRKKEETEWLLQEKDKPDETPGNG
jgi:hypothetical protein